MKNKFSLVDIYGNDPFDSKTSALKIIDYPHSETHSGNRYYAIYSAVKNDTQDIEIRFQTPNNAIWKHWEFSIIATGETTINLYENTTFTHAGGNVLTAINRDRNSSNTSDAIICHTPTGSGDGTAITQYPILIGLDTGPGPIAGLFGGDTGTRGELILKQNTAYLLRIASFTNGNRLTCLMDWYEHLNKDA